ncbi:MAG: hypothetical protein M1484_01015 [Patescibacteria group bacterium]|nr:hypothetical protein [Patescibacteria group bacterium]MCL5431660.1 hypothetical protein [Patescibacteria group bacterium]
MDDERPQASYAEILRDNIDSFVARKDHSDDISVSHTLDNFLATALLERGIDMKTVQHLAFTYHAPKEPKKGKLSKVRQAIISEFGSEVAARVSFSKSKEIIRQPTHNMLHTKPTKED